MGLTVKPANNSDDAVTNSPLQEPHELNDDCKVDDDGGDERALNFLSCASLSFEPTLTDTIQKATLLKG